MWKLDWQQHPRSDFWCFNEWLEWMVLQPQSCDLSKILCEHIQLHSDLTFLLENNFTQMEKCRLWQTRLRHTGSIWGRDMWQVATSRQVEVLIIWHCYKYLICFVRDFSRVLSVLMMNLVCVLLLHGKNYNTIRWGNYCIEERFCIFKWKKITEVREPIIPMRHLLNRMCSS